MITPEAFASLVHRMPGPNVNISMSTPACGPARPSRGRHGSSGMSIGPSRKSSRRRSHEVPCRAEVRRPTIRRPPMHDDVHDDVSDDVRMIASRAAGWQRAGG